MGDLAVFFLTDLDPNAKVKGARDPLGTQSVWSGFGRLVVGNLTTQTTSLNDFRILLIGAWLTDQAAGSGVPRASAFVAWEQLASYARVSARNEGGFRGVTKTQLNLARHTKRGDTLGISSERQHQTLTNQAAYGIWGLYTAAASRSGMISFDASRLTTSRAAAVVEECYVPLLAGAWHHNARELVRWVSTGADLRPSSKSHGEKLEAIARCICDPLNETERTYLRGAVVEGGQPTGDEVPSPESLLVRRRQARLARHLRSQVTDDRVRRHDVEHIAASTDDEDLAQQLEAILASESLLAPAMRIFSHVTDHHGSTVKAVTKELEEQFGNLRTLLPADQLARLTATHAQNPRLLYSLPEEGASSNDRWLRIATALHEKDFPGLIRLLIEQNTLVSRDRGGTVGWVSISPAETINVRLPSHGPGLPNPDRVKDMWLNGYFLDNLLALAREVETR